MAWVKIEQIAGRTVMTPTREKVGNMNEYDVSATGKISDHDVNTIAAAYKGFHRTYMLKSSGVDKFLFIRTHEEFDDTKRSWNVGTDAQLGKPATGYSRVQEWKKIQNSGDVDAHIFGDNTCSRFMVGGNGNENCYSSADGRCVTGGRICQGEEYP